METFLIIVGAMVFGIVVFAAGVGVGSALVQANLKDQKETEELSDEMTMHKVYRAFMDNGITQQTAVDVVSEMGNAGILFRERPETVGLLGEKL